MRKTGTVTEVAGDGGVFGHKRGKHTGVAEGAGIQRRVSGVDGGGE